MKNLLMLCLSCVLVSGTVEAQLYTPSAAVGTSNNAYIGIGTPNPGAKLQITSTIERESFRILLNTNASKYLSIWQGTGAAAIDPIGTGGLFLGYDQATDVYIGNAGGKLGIGTVTPQQAIHIKPTSHAYIELEKPSSAFESGLVFARAGSGQFYFYVDDGNDNLKIQAAGITGETDATPRMEFPVSSKNIYMAASGGNVGIGTNAPGSFKLAVEGKIGAREINVTTTSPWPDYVFETGHKLPSLETVERYIKQNKHLPEIPTAEEVKANGVDLGEMNTLMLKKIEELTLYVIDLKKENVEMKKENSEIKKAISELRSNK